MVNTALEVSPHDPEIRALVKASLGKVEDFFFEMIEAAKSEGAVPRVLAPRTTAQALLGLFLGLRVLTRSGADTATLNAVISQAKEGSSSECRMLPLSKVLLLPCRSSRLPALDPPCALRLKSHFQNI